MNIDHLKNLLSEFDRNIRFNLIGGGTLYLPPREVKGFYKDFITGNNVVEVNNDKFEVRNSQEEIQEQLSRT